MVSRGLTFGLGAILSLGCAAAGAGPSGDDGLQGSGGVFDPNAAGTTGAGIPTGGSGGVGAGLGGTDTITAGTGSLVGGGSGGSDGLAGTGSIAGAGGAGGTGSTSIGPGHEGAVVDPIGTTRRAPGFVDLSPPLGEALPTTGDAVTPAPPSGWTWHAIDGALCRDGSQTGIYVHRGTGDGLLIYFEGGGACSNDHYCAFNPKSVDQVLAGDGQVVIGSALGAGAGRQQPGVYTDASHVGAPAGIFDTSNAVNPFKDWNQVYIPYCTGDVHFGTNTAGTVPNVPTAQKFVGYHNTRKFVSRIVPTFQGSVSKVVLAGSSAGGFGAALNFSMVQDAFGDTEVMVVDDSGLPFEDEFMPTCMQEKWRTSWGLDGALPPDCDECRDPNGGNLLRLADFLLAKHPTARIASISSMQDEVIRLFYSVGLANCANYDTADPVAVVLFQGDPNVFFPATQYEGGLNALRTTYGPTGRFATYYIGGANITFHQHLFRPRFYEAPSGGKTIAQFVSEFLGGSVQMVGP